jgi:CubicO group peptidase (beta-lactamase class C family)
MRIVGRIVIGLVAVLAVLLGAAVIYLIVAPPELLRVATGYSAKIVCSNLFIAGRDPEEVLAVDVQAPGHPVLKFVRISVDEPAGMVTARMLGLFATSTAIRRTGLGCASVPDGNIARAQAVQLATPPTIAPPADAVWPDGGRVEAIATPALADIMGNAALMGPGMRAVVVVKDGRIVAETYGAGFGPETPLLGWSMTKTVTAALIGRLAAEGKIGLDDAALRPEWTDARQDIRIRDLLGMESGLAFNEDYGDVSDVNRMLFLEPDMAEFTAAQPQVAARDTAFNYSSGTATLLARIWMDRIGDEAQGLAYPRAALFEPLGMASAQMEADAAGTLVGGSYMYATARDWARFGQFLLQDGRWNGAALLPAGWVAAMTHSNGLPGTYSQMLTWLDGPHDDDAADGVPADAYWLIGHDGQTIAIVPSEGIVVVRLGLTPSALDYHPERLVKAVADAT